MITIDTSALAFVASSCSMLKIIVGTLQFCAIRYARFGTHTEAVIDWYAKTKASIGVSGCSTLTATSLDYSPTNRCVVERKAAAYQYVVAT